MLEEPRSGLFGLMRGEARVRARIMPTADRFSGDPDRSETDARIARAEAARIAVGQPSASFATDP